MSCATYHAKKRCEERCGIKLDRATSRYIIHCIKHGNYRLIKKETNNGNRVIVEVIVHNNPVRIVYLKNSQIIITVLPNNDTGEKQNG